MVDMISLERRALYNLLRMNWIQDPQMEVDPWQVEDYRTISLETLFDRLRQSGFHLEKTSYIAYANECDSPEELTENFIEDDVPNAMEQDQIYLIIFELWRRLVPEKPCLSIFCDELDYQIYLYDRGELTNSEHIQDVISEFQVILNEYVDRSVKPQEAFESITSGCANDVETFLYDYISEQIDENNLSYASDLYEAFFQFIGEKKWFTFLKTRLLMPSDPVEANKILKELIQKSAKEKDLEFNMEMLASMVQQGNQALFYQLIKGTVPLLETEEDFQDLLTFCIDFNHLLDNEDVERKIQDILEKRPKNNLKSPIIPKDNSLAQLLKVIASNS